MNRTQPYRIGVCVLIACGIVMWAVPAHPALAQAAQPAPAPDLAALVNQLPAADPDGKYTGPAPEQAQRIYEAVLQGGKDSVLQLVGMLVEPGKGEDYKPRYLLHGLAIYVGRPGAEDQHRVFSDALISALDGGAPKDVKRSVIQELQFLGEPRAVAPIAKLVLDETLYDDAVRALVAIKQGAAPPLAEALPEAQGRNRLVIIQALGELRHRESAPALIRLLGGTAGDERVAAAVALSKIAERRAVEPSLRALEAADGHERTQLSDACLVLAGNLLEAGSVREALRMYTGIWKAMPDQAEPQMRHAVVAVLAARLGSPPTAGLVERLKTDDPALRGAVVYALGQRADAEAFPAVASAMSDKDSGVRLMAISALGPVGQEKSIPLLIAALPGETPQATQTLRTALLTVPGEKVNDALAAGLANVSNGPSSPATRWILLDILMDRRATQATDAIFQLTSDEEAAVRTKALQALATLAEGRYAPRLVELVPKAQEPEELKALEDALVATCLRIPNEAQRVEPLLPALATTDVPARCLLLRAAGRIGTAASVSVLVQALEDANAVARDTAMRSLSDFPNDRAAPKLLEIAKATGNLDHCVLALRGYVRLAEQRRTDEEKCAMLREAMGAARRLDEKKLVLGSLGNISSAEAITAAASYLTDPALTEAAGSAAVKIARGMRGRDADKVKQALQQVVEHVKSAETRKAASDLLAGM